MRAVVTGAAGFIGKHMVQRLLAEGWHVVQIDTAFPAGFATDCREWFAQDTDGASIAVHCAAVIGGRAGIDGRPIAVAEDFELDAAYARWCLRTRPDHVVYFSSSAAYPVAFQAQRNIHGRRLHEEDINLDDVEHPDAIYGLVKVVGETLMRHLERAGVRTHVFRPFSGWGSDQSLDYPMPTFLDRARRREDPFTIWGDGEQVRDWIHVDDVVGAVMAAIDQDVRGPLNLGTGVPVSFNDLAGMVCAATGYRPRLRHLRAAPQGVRYRVCDPTRMLRIYQPRVSLAEGIERALAPMASRWDHPTLRA